MNNPNPVATYALRLGDNGLVLAQRLGARAAMPRSWRSIWHWPTSASTCLARRATF